MGRTVTYRRPLRLGDQVVVSKEDRDVPGCWGVVANFLPDGLVLVEVARTKKMPKIGRLRSPYPVTLPVGRVRHRRGKEGDAFRDTKKHHYVPRLREDR